MAPSFKQKRHNETFTNHTTLTLATKQALLPLSPYKRQFRKHVSAKECTIQTKPGRLCVKTSSHHNDSFWQQSWMLFMERMLEVATEEEEVALGNLA